MPRTFFRRIMPSREYLQDHRFLRHLGEALHDSNLWHINRHCAATAVFIGLFCAFMPIPLQMLLAAALAIALRGNLPVAVAVVWISNPITMAPILYGEYRLGAWLMGITAQPLTVHLDLEGWLTEIKLIWQPLLLGSLICGVLAGSIGYATVKIIWRIAVTRQWRKRAARRQSARQRTTANDSGHADTESRHIAGRNNGPAE